MSMGTIKNETSMSATRIDELDYLKCVMIVLMISFHLAYFSATYPYGHEVVYTFHMPVFLLISGYLMNMQKTPREFLTTIFWFAVPYVVMESGYTIMASMLPINEHIDHLTPAVFAEKLFLHPLGPYWFLQTLILCELTCYSMFHISQLNQVSKYILIVAVFAVLAHLHVVSLSKSFYFLVGIIIRQSSFSFLQVFRPSWLAILALVALWTFPANLVSSSIGCVLIVYSVISLCLAVYPYITGKLRDGMLFIGRNTLPVFLFSPIFTFLCKPLVPLLSFDSTALLFLVASLLICITGSLSLAWLMTRWKWTNIFHLKQPKCQNTYKKDIVS